MADTRSALFRRLALSAVLAIIAQLWTLPYGTVMAAETRQETIKRISDRALSPGAFSPRPPELLEMLKDLDSLIQAKADDAEAMHLRGCLLYTSRCV